MFTSIVGSTFWCYILGVYEPPIINEYCAWFVVMLIFMRHLVLRHSVTMMM